MGIVDELLELADSTITVTQGTTSGSGAWTPAAGAPLVLPCRYEEGVRTVQDAGGQPVASGLLCIVLGVLPQHDPSKLRFTIPTTYTPNVNVRAVHVVPVRDETGVIAAEVSLP